MKNLEFIYQQLVNHFKSRFDFTLLTSGNIVFIGLTYIKRFPGLPLEIFSAHFFPIDPDLTIPTGKTTIDLLRDSTELASNYLENRTHTVLPYQDETGYADAVTIDTRDVLVISVIAHPDDRVFLFNSIKNQLNILVTS